MTIEEALGWIDKAIDYWVVVSDYEGKEEEVKKTDEAWTIIVKALKKEE